MLDTADSSPALRIKQLIETQRAAGRKAPDAKQRVDRIERAIKLLRKNNDAICAAVSADFGHRPKRVSQLTGIGQSIGALKHAKAHLTGWMKPARAQPEAMLSMIGTSAEIIAQPKGSVGIIVPWNFPINLAFCPLAGALAAGNGVIIKPSEFTPRYSELLRELVEKAFDETELAVVTGDEKTGEAMSAAPFDHLLFTGSTAVGRHVMRAAADNLTPVTLELGGKSPVIVGNNANIGFVARRLMAGKLLNSGQACVAPDYVLVPAEKLDRFVEACTKAARKLYPKITADGDFTTIISERHFTRLEAMVTESHSVETHPETSRDPKARLFPPVLLPNPDLDSAAMQEEIFGPVLPIVPIDDFDAALRFINDRPHPLALYYFGNDKDERARVLSETMAGGVTINDTILHQTQDNLPFGGVGASGMGGYHGKAGFDEFSHFKPVLNASRSRLGEIHYPPFGRLVDLLLKIRL